MKDRRMATRPHYRQSAERDFLLATAATFTTGAMCGVLMAIGWLA